MLQSKVAKDKWNVDHTRDLLSELDNLPLAITQAAAFISDNHITIKEYLDILHESKLGAADLLSEDLQDPRRDLDAPSSVMQTWKISFDQIRKQEPRAADVLSLMAVLDRQAIPKMVLSQKGDRAIDLTSALGTLQAFSLITAERGGASFEIHRLVQLSTRTWLELQGDIAKWQQEALARLSNIFPDRVDYEDWVICEALYPHTQIILQYESLLKSHLLSRALLLKKVADYNMEQGRYRFARAYSEEAMTIYHKQLGSSHQDTLSTANLVAIILYMLGKYQASEHLHRQTLEAQKEKLGPEHSETLISMNNLAAVLQVQGKYEAAEEMHRKELGIQEERLGPEDLGTLISMNNLAAVLAEQGKYKAAEEMQQKVLRIREKRLGLQHPHTILSMSNLGAMLQGQGKYEAAEQMYRKAQQYQERYLGLQHPDTLLTMNKIGIVLRLQREYKVAEPMLQQALESMEKALGPLHPRTLICVFHYAYLRYREEDYDQAISLMRRAHIGAQETLGKDHPDTLGSAEALSLFSKPKSVKRQQAKALQRRESKRIKYLRLTPPTWANGQHILGLQKYISEYIVVTKYEVVTLR